MINIQMRDLLTKLAHLQLTEAQVQPGEKKEISFKLKKLDKVKSQLDQYQNSLYNMNQAKLPTNLAQEMKQLQEKLKVEIAKVEKAYEIQYEKSQVNDRPVKMDNLFKALAKNCKDIIKVYKELNRNNFDKERFLFRGIRSTEDALYGKPFDARKPKDSNAELHELVNNTINKLGFEATRENAMFVTGDRTQASGYGNDLYIMFPVDGFSFTWSKTVKDLVLDSSKKREMLDKNVVSKIRELATQAKQQNTDFPIGYPNELFSSGYNYDNDINRVTELVNKGMLPDTVKELLDNILTSDSIQSHFLFTDKDLFNAILSNKEIYIKGSYYAVNVNHKKELFKFLASIDTDTVDLPENFGEVPDITEVGDIVKILKGPFEGSIGTVTYVYSDSLEIFINAKNSGATVSMPDVELYKLPDGSIPVYEKNDKVIVTDPESKQYGLVADLKFVYPNGKVEFTDENGNYYSLYKNQINLYSPEIEQDILKAIQDKSPTINEGDLVVVSDPDSEFYKERGKANFIYSTGKIEVYLQKKNTYIEFEPNQLVLLKNASPELTDIKSSEFNVGDTVIIKDGEYNGYYGKVDFLHTNTEKADISLTGMNKTVTVPIYSLEHHGKKEEEPENKDFKIGDKVKVVSGPEHLNGKTGTVEYVYSMYPEVSIIFDDEEGQTDINVKNVKKIGEAKPKLKVGDKVKILVGDNAGEEAIVNYTSEIFPDEVDLKLVKNGYLKTLPVSGLELVINTDSFLLGDMVKITGDNSGFHGQFGKIVKELDEDGDIFVQLQSGIQEYFKPQDLTKVEQTATINVGDHIKVIEIDSTYNGQVGEVIETGVNVAGKHWIKFINTANPKGVKTFSDWVKKIDKPTETYKPNDKFKVKNKSFSVDGATATVLSGPDNDGDYKSVTTDGKIVFTAPDQMEKLPEESAKSKFSVGDTVKINGGGDLYNDGELGKVTTIDPMYDTVSVVFPDGTTIPYLTAEVKKVESSANDEIDNLTWEPEPEVTAPPAKLNTGDRVEVVGEFISLIGKKGTVTQTTPKYGFVSVQLDDNTAPSSFPVTALKKISSQHDFKIGDHVEIVKNGTLTGKTGKIESFPPGKWVSIISDDDGSLITGLKKDEIKLADRSY